VRVVQGDTDFCPFDAGTFGSRSMPDSGEALRRAAAGAREELARQPLEPGERRLVVLREEPALTAPTAWRLAGRSGHAAERVDAVTGHRRYVSDLERPGMLHGAVLRPPVPGARLVAFDAGRLATVRGASNPQLVEDGDLVGVLAGDEMLARRGVETLEASFEDRPPGPENIVAHLCEHPAEPEGWERALDERDGDVEQALASSDQVLEESYTTAYLAHTPLETRAAVAEWEGGRLTVWVGTQTPFRVRAQLAGHLGLPEKDVRVIVPPTGGAFGGKHGGDVALEAARLARVAGRPVRVHWSRAEEIVFGYLRPMAVIDVRAGLDSDGRLTAWDFTDYNAGTAGIGFPYRAGAHRIRYQPAASPVAQGSYRALAATANHFARESHLDGLAHLAGVDPLRFRLEHLEDERLAHVLEVAAGRAGWRLTSHADASPTDQPPTNGLDAPGRNDRAVDHDPKRQTGHGLAAGLEKGGRVATCADVSVDEDGSVKVTRIVTAYDCGAIVNPDTVVNQIEGATVMALGGALREAVPVARGRVSGATLVGYEVPRFSDIPQIEVILVDRPDLPPAGAGETPLICVAPAIGNAIFDATSRRVCSLPMLSSGR
jgi:nicotinate dehydrogenase subunit B